MKTVDLCEHSNVNQDDVLDKLENNQKGTKEETSTIKFNVYMHEISINKPLIALKLSLFIWFAAAFGFQSFLPIFLKQRGLSLKDIFIIFTIASILQIFFSALCGIAVDKLGQLKSILILNVILVCVVTLCLVFIPSIYENKTCKTDLLNATCIHSESNLSFDESCRSVNFSQEFVSKFSCSFILHKSCFRNDSSQSVFPTETIFNSSTQLRVNSSQIQKLCSQSKYSEEKILLQDSEIGHYLTSADILDKNCPIVSKDRTSLVLAYAVLVILHCVLLESVYRLFDVIVVAMVAKYNSDYGRQKIWSTFGILVGPALTGLVVQLLSSHNQNKNYTHSIYLFVILCIITLSVVATCKVSRLEPAKKMWRKTALLSKNIDVFFMALILLVIGTTWGFRIAFKNLHLEKLGSEAYFIGIVDSSFGLYGLPFLLKSKWLIRKLRERNIFLLALLASSFNCFGYSLIQVPWPAVLLESTSGPTNHLFWVTVIHFCKTSTPSDLIATVSSTAGSLHYSFGKVAGSSIGGLIMSKYDARMAFTVTGILNAVCVLIYLPYVYFRRRNDSSSS